MYIFLPPLPLADNVAHTLTHYKRGREKGKRGKKVGTTTITHYTTRRLRARENRSGGKGYFCIRPKSFLAALPTCLQVYLSSSSYLNPFPSSVKFRLCHKDGTMFLEQRTKAVEAFK